MFKNPKTIAGILGVVLAVSAGVTPASAANYTAELTAGVEEFDAELIELEEEESPEVFTSGEIDYYQPEEVEFSAGEAELFTDTEPEARESKTDVILAVKEGDDITKNLNELLFHLKDLATDQNQYRVIIPPGNYQITGTVCMYSNLHLYAAGAVIKKTSPDKKIMLRLGNTEESLGGYDGYRNVTIEGGTWDANYETVPDKEADGGFVGFRIGHATNVVIKNVTFLNNLKSHFLELGGVKNARITGCKFSGYWKPYEGGGQECIQIDVCKERILPGYLPYDGSVCEDIYIEGNTFDDVFSGVGSHSMVFDRPYKNIVIRNNTFRNVRKRAVWCLNYKDSVVENNKMIQVGGGVYARSVYSGNTHLPDGQKVTNAGNQKPQNLTIANNEIVMNDPQIIYGTLWRSFGVHVVGERCAGAESGVPDGTYIIRGVNVKNNKISGTGNGIRLLLADNCSISGNEISLNPTTEFENTGVGAGASSSNRITKNRIQGAGSGGVYIYRGAEDSRRHSEKNVVSENVITACGGGGVVVNIDCDNAVVEKNTITDIPGNGIGISYNMNASVTDNTVSGSRDDGILVQSVPNAVITGNKVSTSGKSGIRTDEANSKVTVKNNTVTESKTTGIYLCGADNSVIAENSVAASGKDGICVADSKNVSVDKNTIKSSRGYGIFARNSSLKTLKSNVLNENGHTDTIYLIKTTLPDSTKSRAAK